MLLFYHNIAYFAIVFVKKQKMAGAPSCVGNSILSGQLYIFVSYWLPYIKNTLRYESLQ